MLLSCYNNYSKLDLFILPFNRKHSFAHNLSDILNTYTIVNKFKQLPLFFNKPGLASQTKAAT